ncbi:MAG TPA: class I SAM-dependent methyltransferase [Bryobacteraceae bacterium]|nr:class I SAM-dependent methyltransferase [Bryobacteraceae bacterium]
MREILAYYHETREELRLQSGWGALELARTKELIVRHLPAAPAMVLDVGGAGGVYSEWLGSLGYETHLVDPVPRHIEEALRCLHLASAHMGDARTLAHRNGRFDCVLLLGPLYHLTAREERLAALREAARVLRPGGVLFAAAISRYASLLDGLMTGCLDDARFAAIVRHDLREGQHRNPTGDAHYFTTAYFHRPGELREEIVEAGYEPIELAAVEGPAWLARDFDVRWADPARREGLIEAARAVEHEPDLMGVSPHLLAAARKPGAPACVRRDGSMTRHPGA